jgi:hypothetical protein
MKCRGKVRLPSSFAIASLTTLAVRELNVRRYIVKREIAGIDQIFELFEAASYACNIVDSIIRDVRIRIVECAAVARPSFINAGTMTLRLSLAQQVISRLLYLSGDGFRNAVHICSEVNDIEELLNVEIMLAHIIGIKKYEKSLLEIDTVLSKNGDLKCEVVYMLFLLFGCGLNFIDRPFVLPRLALKNIHHCQITISLEYRLE